MVCNTPLWPLLGLTGGRIGPDPINRLVPTCPSTYVFYLFIFFTFPIVSYNLLLWNYSIYFCGTISNPLFSICARRRGLRVNCAEVGLMTAVRLLFFKKHNLAEAQNHTLCMSILVLYPRLSQGEWVAPFGSFPSQVGVHGGWWSIGPVNSNYPSWLFLHQKKLKRSLTETESDYEGVASFPRFIIIESTETPITNLSPFLIEKVISSNMAPVHVKKNKKIKLCSLK